MLTGMMLRWGRHEREMDGYHGSMRPAALAVGSLAIACAHVAADVDGRYVGRWKASQPNPYDHYGSVEYRADGTFDAPLSLGVQQQGPCRWEAVRGGIVTACDGYLPTHRAYLVRDDELEYLVEAGDRAQVCATERSSSYISQWSGVLRRPSTGAPGLDVVQFCSDDWRTLVRSLP